jgi:hypothetical protein
MVQYAIISVMILPNHPPADGRDLKLKAERALATARELQERDPDGSVNRSYYAMFDIARAALGE